jgi:1-acyl-sn-glycerol-3-phosphate acyltransferase
MVSLKDARYQVLKNLFGPLMTDLLCPTEIVGEGNIPSRGAALLVCNHRSLMDPYLFSARTRRVVNWAMAPFVASIPLFGWLAEQAGAISIIKGEDGKSEALIESMETVWRQGRLMGIFPEGMANFKEPTAPGILSPFHGTFMRAVLSAKIPHLPVIPTAIYARRENRLGEVKGALLKLFDPAEKTFEGNLDLIGYQEALLLVGQPLYFDAYYERYTHQIDRDEPPAQTALVEELTSQVQAQVAGLLKRAISLDAPVEPVQSGRMDSPLPARSLPL